MKLLIFIFANLLISSCSISSNKTDNSNTPTSGQKYLTYEEAIARKKSISNVDYNLEIDFVKDSESFTGRQEITFKVLEINGPLRVDFNGGKIVKLSLNNKEILAPDYNDKFITIPKRFLVEGKNKLYVSYTHKFSKTGAGLYRFVDSVDKKVYIYSDFEPFDANHLFPSFDQPDLKASYKLKVKAPQNWHVISSKRESSKVRKGAYKTWTFPKTTRMSTYIFSLHAGPYKVWEDSWKDKKLRVFARQSKAKYVYPKFWFKMTKYGLSYFTDFFGMKFPYSKYDQLVVPDFNAGAMENVAAVTFSERYLFWSRPTEKGKFKLASTLLHEMAHMWFGDYVTMKWWNGLWLNESFATYMASLSLSKSPDYSKNAWLRFYEGMKNWAYWEDQLVTTHPIEVEVENTDKAFSIFDGITYGKGASVLKQFHYLIGDKAFRSGLKSYFHKYAFSNTSIEDFFNSFKTKDGGNNEDWINSWIKKAGLNSLHTEFRCENGKVSSFVLRQKAPSDNQTIREHRTKVAFFNYNKNDKLSVSGEYALTYSGNKTTFPELTGKTCPKFVYSNYQDYDYVKVLLDETSLGFVKKNINNVVDNFTRAMLWQSLWDMVRDGDLKLTTYIDLAVTNLIEERNLDVLNGQNRNLSSSMKYLNRFKKDRLLASEYKGKIEKYFWRKINQAKNNSDFQKIFIAAFTGSANHPWAIEKLSKLLNDSGSSSKIKLDQIQRWSIIIKLSQRNFINIDNLIKAELKRDKSDNGKKSSMSAYSIRPKEKNKSEYYKKIISLENKLTMGEKKSIIRFIFPSDQIHLKRKYDDRFYTNIVELNKTADEVFLRSFSRFLIPDLCGKKVLERNDKFILKNDELNPIVIKALRVASQEGGRCMTILSLISPKDILGNFL
jgi:aminopeptidase N